MTVFLAFFCNILFNFAVGLLVAKFLGPEEYGRFALAHATAIAVQTAFFDWIRLGATRFYSERIRLEDPTLRATLDFGFAIIAIGIVAGACLLLLSGVSFALSNSLILLALGVAIVNGLFDYYTALVRARFHDRLFARLVLVKNVLTFALMGGGAFWFGSAKMTLIGGIISLGGSVFTARAALIDPTSDPKQARASVAESLMRYGLPIVAANLLYLSIPLANRSILAALYGFSETGQFSLAYDFGSKAIQAVGSALDIVLFQIAVATHETRGPKEARQQIGRNMTIVFAMVLPACTGLWLTLALDPAVDRAGAVSRPLQHAADLDDDRALLHGDHPICDRPDLPDREEDMAFHRRRSRRLRRRSASHLRSAAWRRRLEPRHRAGRRHARLAPDADRLRHRREAEMAARARHLARSFSPTPRWRRWFCRCASAIPALRRSPFRSPPAPRSTPSS